MHRIVAGVDLGGTKIQAVVVSDDTVLGTGRTTTPRGGGQEVVEAIAHSVRDALEEAGLATRELGGLGLGAPGAVDVATGRVWKVTNIPGFSDGFALGPMVGEALDGVEVVLENDVRAGVLGEQSHGAGRSYRDFLGVFIGSGVGGGLVLQGVLRRGTGNAGEIGHTTVRPEGRRCGCGRHGCLEAYAGRISMERHAREQHAKGKKTKLFEIMERKGRDKLTSSVIADAMDKGDAMALELVEEAKRALGVALGNAQNLLGLEAIILGGGLADRLGENFVLGVQDEMSNHLHLRESPPAVLASELGDLSGAIGAAVVAQLPRMRSQVPEGAILRKRNDQTVNEEEHDRRSAS